MDRTVVAPRRSHVVSTVAILALSIASSVLGLFRPGHYADPPALLLRTRVEDVVILAVGVPVLAIGLWYAIRGSLRGRIVWLGALAFMAYAWLSRAGMLAFNDFFLGYVGLVALSLFTLIGGTLTTNPGPVYRRLDGRIPRRVFAVVLLLTAGGLALLWLSDIVPATVAGTTPLGIREFGPKGAITYVIDLGLLIPAIALGAYLLWREHRWGFVTAGVLLVFAALVAPTLAALTIIDLQQGVAMSPGMVLGTVLPPAVPGALALWYLYVMGSGITENSATERGVDV